MHFSVANDFDSGERVLHFSPNISTSCVTIGITNDTLIESDELFDVMLFIQMNQSFVELGNDTAAVTIVDSDGGKKLELWYYPTNLGPSI